jgi:hypothetical protein
MATSANNSQTNGLQTTTTKYQQDNGSDGTQKKKRMFGVRVASVLLMLIPHLVTHTTLGAVKGLEVGATRPTEVLTRNCPKKEKTSGRVGRALGTIIGAVAAVPGLLLGTVVGITRSIYKLPGAVKTCWGEGIKVALGKTVESYKIDSDKVVLAVCTVAIIPLAVPMAAVSAAATLVATPGVPVVLIGLKVTQKSEDKVNTSHEAESSDSDDSKY